MYSSDGLASIKQNTKGRLGVGLGLGVQGKLLAGNVNLDVGHYYMGHTVDLNGRFLGYISTGGPAVELQIGKFVLGFSTGQYETTFGFRHFEENITRPYIGWRWVDNEFGPLGARGKLAMLDVGFERYD